jgi:DinB family protein
MPDQRPQSDEHAPHHQRYIDLAAAPVLETLREQCGGVERMLLAIPEDRAGFRYQPDKWTVREVVGHLSDAERVYAYRALAIARADPNPLPKYDPDGYVEEASFDVRTVKDLVAEFLALRESTIQFFGNLPPGAWSRRGTMGGQPLSVRALAFIAAGHVEQHLAVLHERYGIAR